MWKRFRSQIIITIVLIVLLFLPTSWSNSVRSGIKTVITPIVEPIYQSSTYLRKISITLSGLSSLPGQNDQLSAEVSRLLVENARLQEVDHNNTVLRNELNINQTSGTRKLVEARITSRSTYVFQDKISIDVGSNNGIKVGFPVTSSGALVGRVTVVSGNQSEVELVTSSTAVTQAQLQQSRMTGIVRGGLTGLVLENIPQDTKINEGEVVQTSGLGGFLRPGLLIGTVSEVISKKNNVFQSALISPTVSISRLDTVFVELP
ncbi:MAG: rod shape-determining protein MreC [Patescibacteria group bacterium]|jgi:rod shape-determining protein MreC